MKNTIRNQLKELASLPIKVQEEVKFILSAYDECCAEYENGKWHVSAGYGIKGNYADDYRVYFFEARKIFTEQERKDNFERVFGCKAYCFLEGIDSKI